MKNIIKFLIGIGVLGGVLTGGYFTARGFAEKEIEHAITQNCFLPDEWVTSVPGMSNKTIDFYLENLNLIYNNVSQDEKHLVASWILNFTNHHKPERLKEVSERGIEFMLEKGEYKAALRCAQYSRDPFLLKNTKEILEERGVGYLTDPKRNVEPDSISEEEQRAIDSIGKIIKPMLEQMKENDPLGNIYTE